MRRLAFYQANYPVLLCEAESGLVNHGRRVFSVPEFTLSEAYIAAGVSVSGRGAPRVAGVATPWRRMASMGSPSCAPSAPGICRYGEFGLKGVRALVRHIKRVWGPGQLHCS